jgi:hypothetical protein
MKQYTLKNIPPDLYARAETEAKRNFRSLNQEFLARVSRSFDEDDARQSRVHAQWLKEGFDSGPSQPLTEADIDHAVSRGIRKAKGRGAKAHS